MLRVLIADDEPLARARLRRLLADEEEVTVVAECADGASAAATIRRLRPDVVLLDIEMPELDGFDVLDDLADGRRPAVIFVTAYDRHAIRAFEADALDYVLKPVEAARLRKALERARAHVEQGDVDAKLSTILAGLHPGRTAPLERIVVRSKGKISFIRTVDVSYIEAAGNYARVHAGKETALVRETLVHLESRLDPSRFVRIHRSTIINIERVRELRPWFAGDSIVVMTDGTELTLSRTHRERAGELLGLEE
ncbi:MAG: LytTr DNA-binding region [Acidobacteria bacterium]|nr:LytTr DNA-binding region [Acidobacteriota bacterium]